MNTICPDPMKSDDIKPGYMVYKMRPLDKVALEECGTDPRGWSSANAYTQYRRTVLRLPTRDWTSRNLTKSLCIMSSDQCALLPLTQSLERTRSS